MWFIAYDKAWDAAHGFGAVKPAGMLVVANDEGMCTYTYVW